jgi:hypothetical protein
MAMKDMVATKADDESNSSMSNLKRFEYKGLKILYVFNLFYESIKINLKFYYRQQ